jgi:hypothetical protein
MTDDRSLSCSGPLGLTRRVVGHTAFVEVARARGDAVHFLVGLLGATLARVAQPIP